MSEDSVDSLIRQLERLRLQEALVLQNLIAARQRENSGASAQRVNSGGRATAPEREAFRIGGRVVINNPKPRFGRVVNTNDSRAVISKVTATRVYFKTLNGTTTWRARNNLTIVNPEVTWSDNE
jgi:hypothetical protein